MPALFDHRHDTNTPRPEREREKPWVRGRSSSNLERSGTRAGGRSIGWREQPKKGDLIKAPYLTYPPVRHLFALHWRNWPGNSAVAFSPWVSVRSRVAPLQRSRLSMRSVDWPHREPTCRTLRESFLRTRRGAPSLWCRCWVEFCREGSHFPSFVSQRARSFRSLLFASERRPTDRLSSLCLRYD